MDRIARRIGVAPEDIQRAFGGLKNLQGSVQRLESQDLLADRDDFWP